MPSVVIVGAGVFGASVADHLAGNGWRVELVDRYRPGHVRQSSGGVSRLLRFGHGIDEDHTALAWRSRRLWRELEADGDEPLLVPSGVVWFDRGERWVVDSARVMDGLGIPARRLDPAELRGMFPGIETEDLFGGLHEPEAGVLRAATAVRALVARAVRRGAELTLAPAVPDGGAVVVGERRRRADAVVWACGPWLPRLFPGLIDAEVTKQDVLFFGVDPAWGSPEVPGWVDYGAAMYGCGDIGGFGFKAASDLDGARFDPDTGSRVPDCEVVTRVKRYLAHRFPALAAAPVIHHRTCQYTSTPDGRWIVAPHPDHEGVWLLGGGSGHGFKHGPALAERVGALLDGTSSPDPQFGLGARTPGTGLRTDTAGGGSR